MYELFVTGAGPLDGHLVLPSFLALGELRVGGVGHRLAPIGRTAWLGQAQLPVFAPIPYAIAWLNEHPAEVHTCRTCGRTSWNPTDARERYCGACHEFAKPLVHVQVIQASHG